MPKRKLGTNLRYLVESILSIQKRMRDAGLFPNDRELLSCTSCELIEDVACDGRLITYHRNDNRIGQDSCLRFEEIPGKGFRCPQCGTLLQDQALSPPPKRTSRMTSRKTNPFPGQWRIVWMDDWDQDYVDMEVPGHVTFTKNGIGNFQFDLVQAQIDYRITASRVAFTWRGSDEGDEMSGRGFAEIMQEELCGDLYIHLGDESAFRAIRQIAQK